ncbi:MAG: preprotein translocase subunit SecA, partial [Patescibacteria group bacterium]
MSFLGKIFKPDYAKNLKPIVEEINALEPEFEAKSQSELRSLSLTWQKEIQDFINGLDPLDASDPYAAFKQRKIIDEKLNEILPQAFAAVREASKRTLGQRHFDVQLMGGMILHQGKISEMRTGEGKTLAATTAIYLNALVKRGVHVVTVNDYLARRDASWMGQIFDYLGLSVGVIQHDRAFKY